MKFTIHKRNRNPIGSVVYIIKQWRRKTNGTVKKVIVFVANYNINKPIYQTPKITIIRKNILVVIHKPDTDCETSPSDLTIHYA